MTNSSTLPGCEATPEISVFGARFPHLGAGYRHRHAIHWQLDDWRWQVFSVPGDALSAGYVNTYRYLATTLPAGSHVPLAPAIWGAYTQRASNKEPWMGRETLDILDNCGLCLHPPPAETARLYRGTKRVMARTLAGHLPSPFGPGYRPAPSSTRVVYSDASIAADRDCATYGVVSDDGLEASGYLEVPAELPTALVVDWAEAAAVAQAVKLITTDPAWSGVAASDTLLFSDNAIAAGFASGAYSVAERNRTSDPATAAVFASLATEIGTSGCAWVGWRSPAQRDPYLSGRADRLAFSLRRPDVTPLRALPL